MQIYHNRFWISPRAYSRFTGSTWMRRSSFASKSGAAGTGFFEALPPVPDCLRWKPILRRTIERREQQRARSSGAADAAAKRTWKVYVKRNKNDAADAGAICGAVRQPTMRFRV